MAKKDCYISFEEARAFVHGLGLKTKPEWVQFAGTAKRPRGLPQDPDQEYRYCGWNGWADWLGNKRLDRRNRKFRPFRQARSYARSLGLRNWREWVEWSATNERPDDIPAKPADVYEGLGWVCLADWLGSHNYRKHGREFLSFGKAREFMRSLGLKSSREWMVWSASSAKPEDIPAAPHRIYKDKGWIGLNDWLGTYHIENQGRRFRSFESARLYAQGLKLSSRSEWSRWARSEKRPKDIPFHPQVAYEEDGWVSWRNWLGRHEEEAKRGPKPRFRPFQEAREFARALSLRTSAEWRRWAASGQRPRDIPSSPRRVYAGKGWQGMRDWLISDLVDRSETQPRVPVNDVQIREFVTTDQHDLTVTVDC